MRQLPDQQGPIVTEGLKGAGLIEYAEMCGELLGKGHARADDACVLHGYCSDGEKLDEAISVLRANIPRPTSCWLFRAVCTLKKKAAQKNCVLPKTGG